MSLPSAYCECERNRRYAGHVSELTVKQHSHMWRRLLVQRHTQTTCRLLAQKQKKAFACVTRMHWCDKTLARHPLGLLNQREVLPSLSAVGVSHRWSRYCLSTGPATPHHAWPRHVPSALCQSKFIERCDESHASPTFTRDKANSYTARRHAARKLDVRGGSREKYAYKANFTG